MISVNIVGLLYMLGLRKPSDPLFCDFRCSLMMVMMEANVGAEQEVPRTPVKDPLTVMT